MKTNNSLKFCHIPEEETKEFFFDHVHIFCNEQISLHQQKTWELSYIISGKGTRVIGDAMGHFGSGEIVLIPPNTPHHWAFDESEVDDEGKIENITLIFSEDFLINIKTAFKEFRTPIDNILKLEDAILLEGETRQKIQHLLLDMKTESNIEQLSSLIKIIGIVSTHEITTTVGRNIVEDKQSKRLQKIYLFVMDNFHNPITLEEISKHAGMERSAFCTFFKKMTEQSFFSFLANYRIDVACDMLLKTNKTIAEVCIASGFRDIPYFNRVFRDSKQMTPSQFRTLLKSSICV